MDLVVRIDREDMSARFNLSPFVTDWEAARETFISCIADAFREPLSPRPEDFSTAFPTELGEAWCKYRMFGGSSSIVLRADSIAITFSNIVRTDYALMSGILRRAVEILLPKMGKYNEHSYHLSTSRHVAAVNDRADEYLARHGSAAITKPAKEAEMEYRPCVAFSLKTSDGYRVLRRTIESSEVLDNDLFIVDHVFVKSPDLTKFEDEARWVRHLSSTADRTAEIKEQEDDIPALTAHESLGRSVFSRRRARRARQGRPVPEEFLVRLHDESISVDRMDHVERKDMAKIATERGENREESGKGFQGWAVLTVNDAEAEGRSVRESPIESNPFYADIWLNLPDGGDRRDMQKKHSVDLAARASWEDPP